MNTNKFQHFFEPFVSDFGGEVLQEIHTVPYADFLFRSDHVVAELKTLEENKEAEHAKKLQDLALKWRNQGLVRICGKTVISLPQLPAQCQDDWLRLLEPPVEKLIRDGNRQIRSTRKYLRLDGHKGLLLIANEGNYLHTDPVNYMILVSRILKKKKNGQPRFPHIDGVVYFSRRIGTKNEGFPFWASGITAKHDPAMQSFLNKLSAGWLSYQSKVTGQRIVGIPNDPESETLITYVGFEIEGCMKGDEHVVWIRRAYCTKDGCGKDVVLVGDGPDTQQFMQCTAHGVLAGFANYAEYERTMKFAINKVAQSKGLPQIAPDVTGHPFNPAL